MQLNTLEDWLGYLYTLHNKEIDLGLGRVKEVARRLDLLTSNCPTIIVGGTNGKGSTVKGLEAIYQKANYRVCAFTTPFLMKHNEQVRVCGQLANDSEFCSAFEKINQARGDITLTIFEFNTLAVLLIFKNNSLDVLILEVGLGGRLDAVNIIDADVSIVTSIALDHTDRLGDTREKIAFEKAGIFRSNQPAICGDTDPPNSLVDYANQLNAPLYCQNNHFTYYETGNHWTWQFGTTNYRNLPLTSLYLQNMSTALAAITLLQSILPVDENSIRSGLNDVALIGRCEVIPGR